MNISTIIKVVSVVAAAGVVGATVYSKVKKTKEVEPEVKEETAEFENEESEEFVEEDAESNDHLSTKQKVVIVAGLVTYSYVLAKFVKKVTIKQVENDVNSDPTINFMKDTAIDALKQMKESEVV